MKTLRACLTLFTLLAPLGSGAHAQEPAQPTPPQQKRSRIEIGTGASNAVTAVAFSPGGRFLAGGNANRTITSLPCAACPRRRPSSN
jgi:hypothetical protein